MDKKQFITILITGLFLLNVCVTEKSQSLRKLLLYKREKAITTYLKYHPDTTEHITNKMLNYQIDIGMNKNQVIATMGKASRII